MQARAAAAILAGLLALGGWPAPAAAFPLLRAAPALADRPVVVGDPQSLDRLALRNLGSEASDALAAGATHGLSAVALNAVSGLSGLRPSSSPLSLSDVLTLPGSSPNLYSRAVGMAERYRVNPVRRQSEGVELISRRPAGQASWPNLKVPEVRLPAQESQADPADGAEVGGIHLTGQLIPPEKTQAGLEDTTADPKPAVDLVATVPLVPERVDVSAHYRLVDVDHLSREIANSTPQTMGVRGQIALNGGTLLKAGYEVKRQGSSLAGTRADAGLSLHLDSRTDLSAGLSLGRDTTEGPQVRTSVDLGYRLSDDAALRASYTLINFGTRPSPAEGRHQASAELSLRF